MDEFLKMDVFFFVSTIAVVVVGGLAAYAFWRLERVLRHVEHISAQVAAESDTIRHDLADMREDVRRGKGRLLSLLGFLSKTGKHERKS
ncbi:MAG TPA: hypothetical protein VHC20_03005 [Candidatus Paceibacterota bacterium]|nr:hypothetical protein [Candidatus Paceibacterota bacterium]